MKKLTEQQKDNLPSTGIFIYFIPAFFLIALLTKQPIDLNITQETQPAAFTIHYKNNDPVCNGDTWCWLGWRL